MRSRIISHLYVGLFILYIRSKTNILNRNLKYQNPKAKTQTSVFALRK